MLTTSTELSRRTLLRSTPTLLALASAPGFVLAHAGSTHLEVWKNADCGCCDQWVKHLQNYNFSVKANDVEDTAEIRKGLGMPAEFAGCHTARAGGYVIEGHVPALDILRLLRERPQARGLAVPEMPTGSPGMERGGQKDRYDVLLIGFSGDSSVFKSYR